MEQIQLRDGSTTNDKRLTRIKLFDEKSKEYPVRALVDDKSLRSYTWSCGQFLDQGSDEKSPTFETYFETTIITPFEKLLFHTHNDYLLWSLNLISS